MRKTNCEVTEVIKNIRNLRSQTQLLMGLKLANDEHRIVNLALEDLLISLLEYLKGDYSDETT